MLLSQLHPTVVLSLLAVAFIAMASFPFFALRCWKKVEPGFAVVRTGFGGTLVKFEGIFALPKVHSYSFLKICVRTLRYERNSDQPIIFADKLSATLIADFRVRINKDERSVQAETDFLGIETINSDERFRKHFESTFYDSVETIAGNYTIESFIQNRDRFREELHDYLGTDLNGFILDDICIHHLQPVTRGKPV